MRLRAGLHDQRVGGEDPVTDTDQRVDLHLGDGFTRIGCQFRETADDLCKVRYVDGGRTPESIE
jgi:hypothetical protein